MEQYPSPNFQVSRGDFSMYIYRGRMLSACNPLGNSPRLKVQGYGRDQPWRQRFHASPRGDWWSKGQWAGNSSIDTFLLKSRACTITNGIKCTKLGVALRFL